MEGGAAGSGRAVTAEMGGRRHGNKARAPAEQAPRRRGSE